MHHIVSKLDRDTDRATQILWTTNHIASAAGALEAIERIGSEPLDQFAVWEWPGDSKPTPESARMVINGNAPYAVYMHGPDSWVFELHPRYIEHVTPGWGRK